MVRKSICGIDQVPMLFSPEEMGMKVTGSGSCEAARFTSYIHTREALGRLLMCYPMDIPLVEVLERARVDFTRGRKGGEV